MKTIGMSQQLEGLRLANGREHFAYFMEQGTGKTWTLLADAERSFSAGLIDGVFVVAPKGVHTNWTRREIPEHLEAPHIALAWTSGMGKRARAKMEDLFIPRGHGDIPLLRILTMNYEALNTKEGWAFAVRFVRSMRVMAAADESSRIKNHKAIVTKRLMELKPYTEIRRLLNGTPITNSPLDAFGQMQFLEEGLLGTTSYRAFVAEFAEVLPATHPMMLRMIRENPSAAYAQIIAKDERGEPRYRNLDKLKAMLSRNSYRVLKKECLDLPDKIYTQVFFDLSPKQRAAYDLLENDLRVALPSGDFDTVQAIASIVKLQQITSGYVNVDGAPLYVEEGASARIEAVMQAVEDCPGKFIVWARFVEELRMVCAALRKAGIEVVEYHGATSKEDRETAVDSFQKGSARAFVGNPQAGGIGLTLTAAETVIYCSNSYNSMHRLQSEDRCHRIGTKHSVAYIDIAATNTIDESITRAHQRKTSVARAILEDRDLAVSL